MSSVSWIRHFNETHFFICVQLFIRFSINFNTFELELGFTAITVTACIYWCSTYLTEKTTGAVIFEIQTLLMYPAIKFLDRHTGVNRGLLHA